MKNRIKQIIQEKKANIEYLNITIKKYQRELELAEIEHELWTKNIHKLMVDKMVKK